MKGGHLSTAMIRGGQVPAPLSRRSVVPQVPLDTYLAQQQGHLCVIYSSSVVKSHENPLVSLIESTSWLNTLK